MRKLLIGALAATLVSLPACAVRQVEATPPTVTYAYNNDDDYDEIQDRADQYCEENYDADAVLADRVADDGGYKATFACE